MIELSNYLKQKLENLGLGTSIDQAHRSQFSSLLITSVQTNHRRGVDTEAANTPWRKVGNCIKAKCVLLSKWEPLLF